MREFLTRAIKAYLRYTSPHPGRGLLARLARRLNPGGVVCRVCPEVLLRLDFSEPEHAWYLSRKCHIFAEARAVAAQLREGATVIDLGANIGIYAVVIAKRVGPAGRVIAFEPVPATRMRLNANLELNGVRNVEVRPEAVTDHDGVLPIFLSPSSSLASLHPEQASASVEVPCLGLDNFVERAEIGSIDLIKVDIEGAELSALRGMDRTLRAPNPPMLQLEIHTYPQVGGLDNARRILDLLTTYSYLPHRFTSRGRELLTPDQVIVDLHSKRAESYLFLRPA